MSSGRFAWMLASALLLACTSNNGAAPIDDAGAPLCATDPRGEQFVAGLVATGEQGHFATKLLDMSPEPLAKGTNEWDIELDDAQGTPVDGATLSLLPYMPDHQHGSSLVPQFTASGGGKYHVSNIVPFMPGIWQLTFTITAGGLTDKTAYTFCVAD